MFLEHNLENFDVEALLWAQRQEQQDCGLNGQFGLDILSVKCLWGGCILESVIDLGFERWVRIGYGDVQVPHLWVRVKA